MIVTPLSGEHNTLRVLSIVEGWRLLIAPTLAVALELRQREDIGVILYDQDLPGVKWHEGVVALLKNLPPTCLILLSSVIQERARISLLATGGYDVTRKPVESKTLVRLVKGALALRNEIEFSRITHDEVTEL
jgi:DNA-binding response OmpR family regulator